MGFISPEERVHSVTKRPGWRDSGTASEKVHRQRMLDNDHGGFCRPFSSASYDNPIRYGEKPMASQDAALEFGPSSEGVGLNAGNRDPVAVLPQRFGTVDHPAPIPATRTTISSSSPHPAPPLRRQHRRGLGEPRLHQRDEFPQVVQECLQIAFFEGVDLFLDAAFHRLDAPPEE
jgi:hypothetical protein